MCARIIPADSSGPGAREAKVWRYIDRALAGALEQFRGSGDAVLVAHHLRQATTALDELVGAVDVEDILDRVFASFCVGK